MYFREGAPIRRRGRWRMPPGVPGFARLAPLKMTFEAWLYHTQLMELADLARAFPQTTIILNHVGGPLGIGPYKGKEAETFAQWKAGIGELGKCPNVVIKLGGLGMTFGMFDFHTRETPPSSADLASAYKPYIDTCITAFGVDRGMFQSNFPPDGLVRTTRFCGMPSSDTQPIPPPTRRRSCSAVRQRTCILFTHLTISSIRCRAAPRSILKACRLPAVTRCTGMAPKALIPALRRPSASSASQSQPRLAREVSEGLTETFAQDLQLSGALRRRLAGKPPRRARWLACGRRTRICRNTVRATLPRLPAAIVANEASEMITRIRGALRRP